jgi:hypothetical protein
MDNFTLSIQYYSTQQLKRYRENITHIKVLNFAVIIERHVNAALTYALARVGRTFRNIFWYSLRSPRWETGNVRISFVLVYIGACATY